MAFARRETARGETSRGKSRKGVHDFTFHQPASVAEAVSILGSHRGESKVLAGGQSLLLMLHEGLLNPDHVISLQQIAELRGINLEATGALRVGSMAGQREIETSALVRDRWPVLAGAASKIASVHIRHLGTLGGNICHSLIGADLPPVLLALQARLQIAGPSGRREVTADQFFRGFMETAVDEDEILVSATISPLSEEESCVYLKHCLRAVDPSLVGIACRLRLQGTTCLEATIGVGGASEMPSRAYRAEEQLRGRVLNDDVMSGAGRAAAAEIDCISDWHGSAEYRRRMVGVFVRRAIWSAWKGAA